MAESMSIQAILSATDSGFSSTMKNAKQSVSGLSSVSNQATKQNKGFMSSVKSIASGIGVYKLASAGLGAISRGFGAVASDMTESNIAWQTFDGNMQMLGKSPKQISKVQKSLQDFATASIYGASDMATTYAQMAALGVDNTEQLVKGMGGLASSAEKPQQAMKTLSQQMVQALAKPEMQWQDFKLMMESAPSAMSQVAKHMGMSLDDLILGIQDGEIASKDFAQAVAEVGTNEQFSKLATTFKSTGQALDGMSETLANKLMPAFKALDKIGIKAVEGLSDMIDKVDIKGMVEGFTRVSKVVAPAFREIGRHVRKAGRQVKQFFEPVTKGFEKIGEAVRTFGDDMLLAMSYIGLGEWDKAWDTIKSSASTAFNSIKASVGRMVVGMGSNIRSLITNIQSWFSSVDWSSVFGTIGDVMGNIVGTITDLGLAVGKTFDEVKSQIYDFIQNIDFASMLDGIAITLGDIGSKIQNAIFTSLNATSWGEVGHTIMRNIGSSIGGAVYSIGDVGTQIFGWVADKLASVDWNTLGKDVGTWVGEAIQNGIDGIKNFDYSTIDSMFEEIGNVIDELGIALLDGAGGAIEGLADAFGLQREFDNIERIVDGFAKIDWSGSAREFVESLKSAFKSAFSGFTLNDILPEVGFGHGDGTKTVIDWNQFFENIQMGATGKKAYVRIPVEATLESVHVTNPENIEAEIRSQVSGTPAEVNKKVNALLDFILDENGNLTQEVVSFMESQNITGNVDARTLVDYLVDSNGDLMGAIQAMVDDQVVGRNATAQPNVNVNPELILASGHSAGASMAGGVGLSGQIDSLVQSMVPKTPVAMSIPIAPQLTTGGIGGNDTGKGLAPGSKHFDLSGITDQVTAELESLKATVSSTLDGITSTITSKASSWGTSIASAMTTMVTSVTATMTAMTLAVTLGMTAMTLAVTMAMTSLAETVTTTMTSMAETVSTTMTSMVETVTQAMTSMTEAITQAMTALVEAVTAGMDEAVAVAQSGAEGIVSAVSGLYDSMYSAGKSAGEGLADGLSAMEGTVRSAASALASAANVAAQTAFVINSPSKVWRGFGYSAGEGLVDGFDGSQRSVKKSATRLAVAGLPSLKPFSGRSSHVSVSGNVSNTQQNEELKSELSEIKTAIKEGQVIMLDGNTWVGATVDRIDTALGNNQSLGGRHQLS